MSPHGDGGGDGDGGGGGEGGGIPAPGQKPHVPLHFSSNGSSLHFCNNSSSDVNSAAQKSGSVSPHGDGGGDGDGGGGGRGAGQKKQDPLHFS